MPSVVTINVSGLAELAERMRTLNAKVAQSSSKKAVAAAASVVKKAAIDKAPDSDEPHKVADTTVQPGNLKKNIVMKKVKSNLTAEYVVTVRGQRKYGYAARYGRLVEFGTVKMGPEPFLRPAFQENIRKAIDAMAAKLTKEIIKAGA